MPVNTTRAVLWIPLVSLCLFLTPIHASLSTAAKHVPNAELVGKARMKVMFWSVFDATLYADGGRYDADKPFALSLSYLRKLDGRQIVDKTISEIKLQGSTDTPTLKRWKQALQDIIPDVNASTTITGVRDADGNTLFYNNETPIGRIDEPAFTKAFFAIWLSQSSSQPALTRQLIGSLNS